MITVYSDRLIAVSIKRTETPSVIIEAEDRSGSKAKPNEIRIEVYPGKAMEVASTLAIGEAFTFRGAFLEGRVVALRLGVVDL